MSEAVGSSFVALDEAAILSILSCISDTRQRAQLSSVNRLWHECVRTAWTAIDLRLTRAGYSDQEVRHWLSRQLPYGARALQRLHLGFAGVCQGGAAIAFIKEAARFEGLHFLHLSSWQPVSGLLVEQEDLRALQDHHSWSVFSLQGQFLILHWTSLT
ncbi:hypothetical protein WJX73_003456 [Symbiochloris irregularis]|uniref:F-box domain-containing protein n=1 Tax=Symbiochloris irregularis TaxID=706552 RepID=A0AAW1NZH8_9CHLO